MLGLKCHQFLPVQTISLLDGKTFSSTTNLDEVQHQKVTSANKTIRSLSMTPDAAYFCGCWPLLDKDQVQTTSQE